MTPHERLLAEIKSRQKQTEFNEGILTADRYVDTLQRCVGSDLCYRYAAKGNVSFDDVMKKAASVLTYNNPEMLLEEQFDTKEFRQLDVRSEDVELPKNTLMVFKHVLTTPRKDRDGDVLRTAGAKPDPRMLLLWQHVHTLPIGKMLAVAEHNSKKLSIITAIVDLNDLAHDAAVMIENKMGRFSHGFRALDFSSIKEEDGRTTGPGGFDIKVFEVMEASLVSVPSNTDAEVEEVLLSLVSGGKLTSPIMKSYGKGIQEKRPTSVQIPGHKIPLHIDLNVTMNGKSLDEEELNEKEAPKAVKCGCGCGGAVGGCSSPKKTDEDHAEEKGADDKEMSCSKCGGKMVDGVCEKCGYGAKKDAEKAGRVLSSKNLTSLSKAHGHLSSLHDKELLMTRGGKAMCKEARDLVKEVMDAAARPMDVETETAEAGTVTVKQAMAVFLAAANNEQRLKMIKSLEALNKIEKTKNRTKQYRALTGST